MVAQEDRYRFLCCFFHFNPQPMLNPVRIVEYVVVGVTNLSRRGALGRMCCLSCKVAGAVGSGDSTNALRLKVFITCNQWDPSRE